MVVCGCDRLRSRRVGRFHGEESSPTDEKHETEANGTRERDGSAGVADDHAGGAVV